MAATAPAVGQRLSFDGALCTVRYVGPVAGTSGGAWLGVEWDDPTRGKHDGVHKGERYFQCQRSAASQSSAPWTPTAASTAEGPALTPASFVRPTRPANAPRTFLEAVRAKYASEAAGLAADQAKDSPKHGRQIVISGKVAEEVGFDKVRRQLAQIDTLRVVILDGMCVASAGDDDDDDSTAVSSIRTACPSIAELDLSRNLFTDLATVAAVCRELPGLWNLRLNGNRLQIDGPAFYDGAFDAVQELGMEDMLLPWAAIGQVVRSFPALTILSANANQLARLEPPLPASLPLATMLTTLSLEFNDFAALSDLASLAGLRALRNLRLKGCSIARVSSADDAPVAPFSPALHYVDLSYNRVASWAFVDALPDVFPGLTSLRFSHNPIYSNPHADDDTASASTNQVTNANANAAPSTEESYMIAVGRLAALRSLNFSTITPDDRANAEMFYLSRIAKQMAAVDAGAAEAAVVARHRRYAELCTLYGEPTVVRHTQVNPGFLEARLVRVQFCLAEAAQGKTAQAVEKVAEIPKSFDMYAVKGLVGRLFKRSPQALRLVWETGEWDPVAGIEEEEDGLEEEDREDQENGGEDVGMKDSVESNADKTDEKDGTAAVSQAGRWVKREVELKDTPRQFGFCVDGMDVRIRVEVQ